MASEDALPQLLAQAASAQRENNWELAVQMFQRATEVAPENIECRRGLRESQFALYGHNGMGAIGTVHQMTKIFGRLRKARQAADWQVLAEVCEEGLALNPWEPHLNSHLADSCVKLGYSEFALYSYKLALDGEPNNRSVWCSLARLREAMGHIDEALKIWVELAENDALDREAREMIAELRGSLASQRAATGAPAEYDPEEVTLLQQVQADPTDPIAHQRLAAHYTERGEFDRALAVVSEGFQHAGNTLELHEAHAAVELGRYRQQFQALQDAQADEETMTQARHALMSQEIAMLSIRSQRLPDDMRLKYLLGQRLTRVNRTDEAIRILTEAGADPKLKLDVWLALGECFLKAGNRAASKSAFETAEQLFPENCDDARMATCSYYLARIATDDGDPQTAKRHLENVIRIDPAFRDASARLQQLADAV